MASAAAAQVADSRSVAGEGGPVSEVSRDLHGDSRPVHERGNTVGAGSVGSMNSGSVHDGPRRTMISGPVSEISRGPVTSGVPMSADVTVHQGSSGAVKEEMARLPVGEAVAARELRALQDHLRELRIEASGDGEEIAPAAEPQPSLDGAAEATDDPPDDRSAEEQPSP